MVARWESSTRPLFVKTVWRDGQHHVLLEKDGSNHQEDAPSSQGSARSLRSAKITPPTAKKVSSASVKLLLAGVGTFSPSEQKLLRFKSGTKAKKTPSTTTETVIAFKNVRQVLNTRQEHKLPSPVKSNSLDATSERDRVGAVSPYISYATAGSCTEPGRDSLSERVMVWLDLAAQNGNNVREATALQPQGFVTACRISQKRQNVASAKRKIFAESRSSADRGEVFHVESISRGLRSSQSSVSQQSRHSPSVREDSFSGSARTRGAKHQLSSEVEENGVVVVTDARRDVAGNPKDSVKRQLHIFMPNLPKKFSDCDSSILSSKLSTSSLQQRPVISSKNLL